MRFKEFDISEGIGGLEYEQSVSAVLQKILPQFKGQARFINLDCGTAGFCRFGVDLELDVNGKDFNVELKQNTKAQMGGTSVRYNPKTDQAEIVNTDTIDEDSKPFFIAAAKTKKDDIVNFIDFLKTQPPPELHANLTYKFPLSGITKDAWAAAQAQGLLKKLNDKVRFTKSSIIANAYNKKNVYYIQIGGAGLFYLNKNPYNLPIPAFEGEIDIEFRLGRSGSVDRKVGNEIHRVVGASYRCQGRLITKLKSNLSLDNEQGAVQIIQHIIGLNQKTAPAAPPTPGVANQNKSPANKVKMGQPPETPTTV